MSYRVLVQAVFAGLCVAQTPDPAQKVLDELRAIRAALEKVEIGQRALLVLARLQADEGRLSALESRRSQVAAREQTLTSEVAAAARIVEGPPPMVMTGDGSAQPAPLADPAPIRARLAQASSSLKDVAGSRQALDEEIARLKLRIAAMEKQIDDALK